MRLFALLALIVLFAGPSVPLHAQSVDPLTLTLTPEFPRPYETVTLRIGSTLLDLPSNDITIYVDGAVVSKGEQSATFAVKGPGKTTSVRVVAVGSDGTNEATLSIVPVDVALILESSSSAHPFYAGALLPASEDSVRLIALTDFRTSVGASIAPESLVYNWKFGDKQLVPQSGIGKSVLSAVSPTRYRDARVTVTVTTKDKTLVGQASTVVSAVNPIVRIYRHDPLLGIDFAHALEDAFSLSGTEEAFHAVPYYFPSTPTITWSLNGTESGSDPDLTIRTAGTQKGTALLDVSASGTGLFDQAKAALSVQFGQAANSFFGF